MSNLRNFPLFALSAARRSAWRSSCAVAALCCFATVIDVGTASAETLRQALSNAYRYNPRIDAERARLRATDEEVARANSGYRPRVSASADIGVQHTETRPSAASNGTTNPRGYSINLTQPLFTGFQTRNAVGEAESGVRAGRETLRDVERQVLLQAVTAYMDVVRDQAVVRLQENNVSVLSRELKATRDRFAVGEVTRTDVAQAEARRAGATSSLDLARANLKGSRATYERVIGNPPSNVRDPGPPDRFIPKSLNEALAIGEQENALIIASLYREQAARYTVDRIRGELLPSAQLEASWTDRFDTSRFNDETEQGSITGRLSVPIYQGGEVTARVRQAKHIHVSRLQEVEQVRTEVREAVIASWSQLQAARGQVQSDRTQVQANQTALTGVREEEKVGQRTLLDVLNAEQELLNAQVQLVTDERNLVVAGYTVLSAIGRLDANRLAVASYVYDPEIHYEEVRRKWWGVSITHEDGRREYHDLWPTHVDRANSGTK
ncbi:MAG: TolC family outer membrane protein [Hyphomicrobiaceae bacterium]|nr:TolC family outer membrane protein [Hyphomicrobiaceae bacterium]